MPLPQITWQDVQQLPDDGNRHEAIGGDLYVTPAPSIRHQRISRRLQRSLEDLLMDGGHGEVFNGPIGVKFPATGEGVQPDILFVSNGRREIIGEAELQDAPDLVVEIASPSTASRDRSVKLDFYRRLGVGEYWVVDPEIEVIEVWRFGEDPEFTRYTNRTPMDTVPVRVGGEPEGDAAARGQRAAHGSREPQGESPDERAGDIRLGEIFRQD